MSRRVSSANLNHHLHSPRRVSPRCGAQLPPDQRAGLPHDVLAQSAGHARPIVPRAVVGLEGHAPHEHGGDRVGLGLVCKSKEKRVT